MRVVIEAEPGEFAKKGLALLKAIASDLAPASPQAAAVLDALEDAEVGERAGRSLRAPALEGIRKAANGIVAQELKALEQALAELYLTGDLSKAFGEGFTAKVRNQVRRTWLRVIRRVFGSGALTEAEQAEVAPAASLNALDAAHESGAHVVLAKETQGLGFEESAAKAAALESAGNLVRAISDRAADEYAAAIEHIPPQTAQAIEERKVPKELTSALRSVTKDCRRDWDRVAVTELQAAHNQGRADAIRAKSPEDDPEVFKRPAPDACTHCVRLHLGPDGNPRIFKLSALYANGDNVGLKKAQWRAIVGPTHPHCQCELIHVPAGWGFDEDGDLSPEGEGGVRYETQEEIAKAIAFEGELHAAALGVGLPVMLLSTGYNSPPLQIRVEANVGDVRKWRGGQTILRYAYGEILGTKGADGDAVDVYLGPDVFAPFVYAVDQRKPDGSFDEQKVFVGFSSPNAAKAAYLEHYPESFFGGISQLELGDFARKVLVDPEPDGIIKSETDYLYRAQGRDRGWAAGGNIALRGVGEPDRPAPAPTPLALVSREAATTPPRRIVRPPAVVFVEAPPDRRVHEFEPVPPMMSEEERTEEAEKNGAQLEENERQRLAQPMPDPELIPVRPVVAAVPVKIPRERSG